MRAKITLYMRDSCAARYHELVPAPRCRCMLCRLRAWRVRRFVAALFAATPVSLSPFDSLRYVITLRHAMLMRQFRHAITLIFAAQRRV